MSFGVLKIGFILLIIEIVRLEITYKRKISIMILITIHVVRVVFII